MKSLIAANWKMHGDYTWMSKPSEFKAHYDSNSEAVEVLICPPAYLLRSLAEACYGFDVKIGAQNCHHKKNGAFTGEMSADMARDSGAQYVILGHSERRSLFHETDAQIRAKTCAVLAAQLCPVVCVGESHKQRVTGEADEVVGEQLKHALPETINSDNLVIAYEPVWAIGTGLVPTLEDIASMHDHIRGILMARFGESRAQSIRILYGGSVKPSNAKEILALGDVNGALIGGASLDMQSFAAIAKAAQA